MPTDADPTGDDGRGDQPASGERGGTAADGGRDGTPTDAEVACFEAGIKFGSLYHQFAGTPVSPASAASLARAMEESIENQPHCEAVRVEVLEDELATALEGATADYTELTGRFLEVEIEVAYEGHEVLARMAMEDGYPLMRIESVRREG